MRNVQEEMPSFTFHWDGFTYNNASNNYSVRLSNIPKNLNYLINPFTALAYGFLSVQASSIYHFSTENEPQHYMMWFNGENPRLAHLWKTYIDKNPCNLSQIRNICSSSSGNCFPNVYDDYVYDRVTQWQSAELWKRWLDPANKTLESCISTWVKRAENSINNIDSGMEVSSEISDQESTSNTGLLLSMGIFAVSAGALFYNRMKSTRSLNDPHILGKSNVTTPSFSQRMIQLNQHIPEKFLCPISHDILNDPIMLNDGVHYDRASVESLLKTNRNAVCPYNITIPIEIRFYPTDLYLKNEINDYITNLEEQELLSKRSMIV